MDQCVVLAGPTLDQALSLIRLGLVKASPSDIQLLTRELCTGSIRKLAKIREQTPAEVARLLTPQATRPVHLMVADERDTHRGNVIHHVCKQPLPTGSFLHLCDGVLVPSWPLFFVLRCREELNLSKRLMLGMELCGSYSHLVVGNRTTKAFSRLPMRTPEGQLIESWKASKITPAVTTDELADYLSKANGLRGVTRAAEALRYLLDSSASPAESTLALMATLPCKLGGYGFSNMKLNPKVPVKKERRHLTQFDTYHPDGLLEELDTDLEYESNEHHSGPRAIARDKARRNDIQALGIEVKDVTWEMLSHIDSLDRLFEQLLDKERALGKDKRGRHRRMVRHPDNKARRVTRLHELLPPWSYEP